MASNEMLFDVPNSRELQPGTRDVPHGVAFIERAGQPLVVLLLINDAIVSSVMVVLRQVLRERYLHRHRRRDGAGFSFPLVFFLVVLDGSINNNGE